MVKDAIVEHVWDLVFYVQLDASNCRHDAVEHSAICEIQVSQASCN